MSNKAELIAEVEGLHLMPEADYQLTSRISGTNVLGMFDLKKQCYAALQLGNKMQKRAPAVRLGVCLAARKPHWKYYREWVTLVYINGSARAAMLALSPLIRDRVADRRRAMLLDVCDAHLNYSGGSDA